MGLKTHLCIGGTRVLDDIDALRRGVHMVIGTPGRLLALLHGKNDRAAPLDASRLRSWIVDEADEMFREKFELDMKDIYRFLPNSCQVVICSATMDENVMNLAENICRDPIKVLVKKENVPLDGIQQYFVECEEDRWKPGVLIDLWEMLSIEQTIVFVNSKRNAEYLCEALKSNGHTAECIHSGRDCDRDGILRMFKVGTIRVLVATDLLARGIDIQTISTVINVDLPRDMENYIHRIGRCGRFGRKGVSINLVNRREVIDLDRLRRHYNCEIKSMPEDLSKVFGQ
jgi:translation initiation factor 4A